MPPPSAAAAASSITYPVYKYLISRTLDPLFAISVGLAAAVVRIRREEREEGRSDGLREVGRRGWEMLRGRFGGV